MAADALDIRMARLEGAYQQINERLGGIDGGLASIRSEISALRTEGKSDFAGLRSEISALRTETKGDLAAARSEISDLRKQTATQFYWLLTFVLGSVLIPLFRDLAR